MKRTQVVSSNIRSVGFDAGKSLLEVEYGNGAVWRYENVSKRTYDLLLSAESIGGFVAKQIKPNYIGTRVELEPAKV